MKNHFRKLLLAGAAFFSATSASAISLPAGPCDGVTNCIQYTDFQVYSLPLLNVAYNTNAYSVNSTYGQNQSNIIIGINNGQSNNGILIDPAFNTPSANNIATFSNMLSDVGGQFATGDGVGWDASVSALRSSLGTSNLVGFFAFNETGSRNYELDGVDLLIWVHAQLRNLSTNAVLDFYLQPTGSSMNPNPGFYTDGGTMDPWTYVHGALCLNSDGTFAGFPSTSGVCPTGTTRHAQGNLGQNNAAFAVYSELLDSEVKNGNWDILHIDWKMDGLNGGGETAWIMPFDVGRNVPEPASLLLFGIGLVGLSVLRRFRVD